GSTGFTFAVVAIRARSSKCLLRSAHCVFRSSSPANRSHDERIFPSQLDFFHLMADHKAFALAQRVFHLVHADFYSQHLAPVRHGKPKYSVVLRGTTRPE